MGWNELGAKIKAVLNRDLRETLPAQAEQYAKKRVGYLLEDDTIRLNRIVAFLTAGGYEDVNVMNDIINFFRLESAPMATPSVDTTSLASKEWTVGAGKMWKVWAGHARNGTRAPRFTMEITPVAGEVAFETNEAQGNQTQAMFINPIGNNAEVTGISSGGGINQPIKLVAGDKIKFTDNNFVAADVMSFGLLYTEEDAVT